MDATTRYFRRKDLFLGSLDSRLVRDLLGKEQFKTLDYRVEICTLSMAVKRADSHTKAVYIVRKGKVVGVGVRPELASSWREEPERAEPRHSALTLCFTRFDFFLLYKRWT